MQQLVRCWRLAAIPYTTCLRKTHGAFFWRCPSISRSMASFNFFPKDVPTRGKEGIPRSGMRNGRLLGNTRKDRGRSFFGRGRFPLPRNSLSMSITVRPFRNPVPCRLLAQSSLGLSQTRPPKMASASFWLPLQTDQKRIAEERQGHW